VVEGGAASPKLDGSGGGSVGLAGADVDMSAETTEERDDVAEIPPAKVGDAMLECDAADCIAAGTMTMEGAVLEPLGAPVVTPAGGAVNVAVSEVGDVEDEAEGLTVGAFCLTFM